jgi:N-acetylneuraminic acid mutarotase
MSLAHQIFVSHATEDLDTAQRVCKILEADGISCWLATRDVKAGTDYAAAILDAIKSSQLVLLIFSAHANTSPYVLREIERAIAYNRPVLSVRIDDALPGSSMEYYLNLWQWFDAHGGVERQRREIVAAVRKQLDKVPGPATAGDEQVKAGVSIKSFRLPKWSRRIWVGAAAIVVLAAAGALGTWAAIGHSGDQASASTLTTATASVTGSSTTSASALTSTTTATPPSIAPSPNSWTQLDPSGDVPIGRSGGAMVFDPTSDRIIMFGGAYAGVASLNETWAYSPSTNRWTELSPTGSLPPPRSRLSMVWDSSTQRMIMFGGQDDTGSLLNDTWAYDPATNSWTDLRPANPPSARWGHAMVYDSLARRVIMVGGGDATGDLMDTWAYDPKANTWSELTPKGTAPTTWVAHSMVYDPSSNRVIAFGGGGGGVTERNATWAYDPNANTWTELSPSGTLPYPRAFSAMVYDPTTKRVLMFGGLFQGGSNFLNDTWAYDPSADAWTLLAPAGAPPSARWEPSMVYDPTTGQVIMFGGSGSNGFLNDTWVYTP